MADTEITDIETVTQETGLAPLQPGSTQALEQAVESADKYFQLHDRIRRLAVCLTNPNDWIDQADHPYLQNTGATKISNAFGLSVRNTHQTKEELSDVGGDYIMVTTEGEAVWNGRIQPQVGTCTSRDKFIAQRTNPQTNEKYVLPLSEIDITNVYKKSFTNFLNRAIKCVLGLSFTWQEIEDVSDGKITKAACTHFTYNRGGRGGRQESANAGEARTRVRKKILDLADGESNAAKTILKDLTTFTTKDGKTIQGKTNVENCSEKQLAVVEREVDKLLAERDAPQAEGGEQ